MRRGLVKISSVVGALTLVFSAAAGASDADSSADWPALDQGRCRAALDLGRLVHKFSEISGETDLAIVWDSAASNLVLSGRTARFSWMDSSVLARRVVRGFLDLPGRGEIPALQLDARPRFFGYEDEVVAGMTPGAGFVIELLRPARFADECTEMALSCVAMAGSVSSPRPPLIAARNAEIRLQVFNDSAYQRDSFLLGVLFEQVGFPSPFDGFDQLWFGFRADESEARLTRFEAPYVRCIMTTGPARADAREYFTRDSNAMRLERLYAGRRLSVLFEANVDLTVSETEFRDWVKRALGTP